MSRKMIFGMSIIGCAICVLAGVPGDYGTYLIAQAGALFIHWGSNQ